MAWLAFLLCICMACSAEASCEPLPLLQASRLVADADVCHLGARAAAALRPTYTAPGLAVAKGLQMAGNMRRMRQFAAKLLDGENVTVSVAGGSISRGWGDADALGLEGRGYGFPEPAGHLVCVWYGFPEPAGHHVCILDGRPCIPVPDARICT